VSESKRIDELRRRVQKDPASLAFAQLAEELRRGGELQEAIRVCRTGLTQHPEYLSARVTLGRALLASDQLDAAFSELSTALAAAPENLAALRGLAEIQHRRGDPQESLSLYQRALALAPQDADLAAAVAALEPTAQDWPAEPAPAPPTASDTPAAPPVAADSQGALVPGQRPAVDSADPSADFESQQASLAAFYGEPQPEAEAEGATDWLASLDAAAANILRADASVEPVPSKPDVPAADPAPTATEPTPPDNATSPPQAAAVEWVAEVSAVPEPNPPDPVLPDPDEPAVPDAEAARAEVLQRWLDAILASRSGQQSLDDGPTIDDRA
jgi:tetratricopeptide (TPR) repeat protein